MPRRLRATFTSILRQTIIIVYDHSDKTGGVSVAKDAWAVVAACLRQYGDYRIIVRHPDGTWSALHHDGENFLQISPLKNDYVRRIADYCGIRV